MNRLFTFLHVTRAGWQIEITVPGKFEVCDECEGSGTELYGGLKGAVFSSCEMNEDPEFRDNYFGGAYDVACSCCKGERVVLTADRSRMTKRQLILLDAFEQAEAAYKAELHAEQSMRERGIQW